MKSKGDNVKRVPSTCQAGSNGSFIIVVTVILTGGRGMGIVFSASFFLAGELGYMGQKGDCPILYSVLDVMGLVRAFAGLWP